MKEGQYGQMVNASSLHHDPYFSIQLIQQIIESIQLLFHMQYLKRAAHNLSIRLKYTDGTLSLGYVNSYAYHSEPPLTVLVIVPATLITIQFSWLRGSGSLPA